MSVFTTTIEFGSGEVEVGCEYSVIPGQEEVIHKAPEFCQPGYDREIIIEFVWWCHPDGVRSPMRSSLVELIEEQLVDEIGEMLDSIEDWYDDL